jgi:hypothetical protein
MIKVIMVTIVKDGNEEKDKNNLYLGNNKKQGALDSNT